MADKLLIENAAGKRKNIHPSAADEYLTVGWTVVETETADPDPDPDPVAQPIDDKED